MILVNTTESVRAYLATKARTELSRTGRIQRTERLALEEIRATSQLERQLMGRLCPRCGAREWLCFSPTGLPASGPHPERAN